MRQIQKWFLSLAGISMLLAVAGCTASSPFRCFEDVNPSSFSNMKVLKNNALTIGVLPECGGNIVYVKPAGGYNLLYSKPASWPESKKKVDDDIFSWIRPVKGHALWLSPQSQWWQQQDIYPEERTRQLKYTPDPHLVHGTYAIKACSDKAIWLKSHNSPVSGVTLEKKIQLLADANVKLSYKMTNTSQKTVSWGMWSNTRFNGRAVCFAPVDPKERIEINIDLWQPETRAPMIYDIIDHYFFFDPAKPIPAGKARRVAKAYLSLRQGKLFTFVGNWLFIKEADPVPRNKIHPEHAFAEIYQNVEPRVKTSLLEVEMHSPYYTLKPGEQAVFNEQWQILPYPGKNCPQEQVRFLQQLTGK